MTAPETPTAGDGTNEEWYGVRSLSNEELLDGLMQGVKARLGYLVSGAIHGHPDHEQIDEWELIIAAYRAELLRRLAAAGED